MSDTPWNDPPTRRPLAIPFDLPAYWSQEQALAVVELLDHLRERIASHYAFELSEAMMRERGCTHIEEDLIDFNADPDPF